MSEIVELWRLPDKRVMNMDGSFYALRRIAIRQRNWHGFYEVFPDHSVAMRTIPEGSVPLILDGEWLT